MTRVVFEPPEGADYPSVVFESDEDTQNVSIAIGEKKIVLSFSELAALHSSLTHLVNYGYNAESAGPRGGETGQEVRSE